MIEVRCYYVSSRASASRQRATRLATSVGATARPAARCCTARDARHCGCGAVRRCLQSRRAFCSGCDHARTAPGTACRGGFAPDSAALLSDRPAGCHFSEAFALSAHGVVQRCFPASPAPPVVTAQNRTGPVEANGSLTANRHCCPLSPCEIPCRDESHGQLPFPYPSFWARRAGLSDPIRRE